jgi:hypothetical protein
MPTLRRGNKIRREKHKPEAVTGSFELHYEDVVSRNRFALVLVFATSLLVLVAFIPSVVNRSVAGPDKASIEAEAGTIVNPELVTQVENDITASGDSYIEFQVKPAE